MLAHALRLDALVHNVFNWKSNVADSETRIVRADDESSFFYCRCSSDGLTSVFLRGRDKEHVAKTHLQTKAKFAFDPL